MADACLNCRLLISFICILFFLVAITLKINQTWSHISWFLIFIPIWIFNFVSICILMYLILMKGWFKKQDKCSQIIYYFLALLSSCLFEIFLCIKLQYKTDMSYWKVFVPLWFFIFLILNIIGQQMYRTCQSTITTTTQKTM